MVFLSDFYFFHIDVPELLQPFNSLQVSLGNTRTFSVKTVAVILSSGVSG